MSVSGLARSFFQPARTALGADIVPRETYANAVTWRSSLWQFAAVVGPAVGGVIYGFSGARLAYIVEAVFCVLALGLFAQISYTRHAVVAEETTIGENLTVGMRWLMTQPELLGAQLLDLFSVLFGGAPALLPIFAAEILHAGPQGLGVLRAAPAAGAGAGSRRMEGTSPRRGSLIGVKGSRMLCAVGASGAAPLCRLMASANSVT